jgi:hypothetical protein
LGVLKKNHFTMQLIAHRSHASRILAAFILKANTAKKETLYHFLRSDKILFFILSCQNTMLCRKPRPSDVKSVVFPSKRQVHRWPCW